jgi:acyl-CoA synthetase (AMP-forming)/AMP-acid ligase II
VHVGHLLTRAARRWPGRPAWIAPDRAVGFAEAEARVNRLAHALLALGGEPGDRVAMLLPNGPEGLETILAPMKAGLAVVPLNVRLHPEEHAYMLEDSGAFCLVYAEEFRDHLARVEDRLGGVRHRVCVGRDPGPDRAYEALLEHRPPTPPDPRIEPDDLAWLFYTSGTTGHPKGAMLTHRNLLTMVEQFLLDLNPARPDDVLLHAAPITHGSGLCAFHHIARGAASAFPATRTFDPPRIYEAIARHRVTTMFLAPTMVHLLASHPARVDHDLSSLHTILYGGGPMYVEQLQAAVRAFGPILVQLFGQAEAPMTCTCLPRDAHVAGDDPARLTRLASAGRETPAVRVAIVDDADRCLPPGETGEIVVRGDLVMKGYWRKPEATAETLRSGWLHTGDVGHLDAEGYLFLTDRRKDLIISGGANVYPREVEEVLCRHPAVYEAAVIGVPDPTWGESVKALVVLREGHRATGAELIEHCRQHLASYKKPASVELRPALPKNAYGKILKRELREPYWAGRARRV